MNAQCTNIVAALLVAGYFGGGVVVVPATHAAPDLYRRLVVVTTASIDHGSCQKPVLSSRRHLSLLSQSSEPAGLRAAPTLLFHRSPLWSRFAARHSSLIPFYSSSLCNKAPPQA